MRVLGHVMEPFEEDFPERSPESLVCYYQCKVCGLIVYTVCEDKWLVSRIERSVNLPYAHQSEYSRELVINCRDVCIKDIIK